MHRQKNCTIVPLKYCHEEEKVGVGRNRVDSVEAKAFGVECKIESTQKLVCGARGLLLSLKTVGKKWFRKGQCQKYSLQGCLVLSGSPSGGGARGLSYPL